MVDWKDILGRSLVFLSQSKAARGWETFQKALDDPQPPPRLIPPPIDAGHTESFDGTPIYWERHGPDPATCDRTPILFCYGLVCSMSQWRLQLERYSKERPCLLFDYRGHHQSPFPANAASMNLSALAKDAAAVVRHVAPGRPVHVWGHSLGVNVALELAVAEPTLCRSLTLCCGTVQGPFRNMFGHDTLDYVMSPLFTLYPAQPAPFDLAWKLLRLKPEVMELSSRILGFNMDASSPQDVATYARSVVAIDPKTFYWLMRDFSKGLTEALLPQVRVPSLVIAGSKDTITPPAQACAFAAKIPRSRYVEIPAGSHNVQLDFGDYIALKAEEFWRDEKLDEPVARATKGL